MNLQNEFEYYKKKTNKYHNLIKDNVEQIIKNIDNGLKYSLDSEYFNEISIEILKELKRINNKINDNIPIIDEDVINLIDEVTKIKNDIQENILYEIKERGFKATLNDGIIKITKS